MTQTSLLSSFISLDIMPSILQDVCQCSLDIVENASSHQINAAAKYNENEINRLLIQLLTINFISKNKQNIENNMKKLNLVHNNKNNINSEQLANYCNQKLLEISPIHGFSPEAYFTQYKISNDVRMEILSYLKPIQLFKTISLLNKQFNKNVSTMHESRNSKYMTLFNTSNFTFHSMLEFHEYCSNNHRKSLFDGQIWVDWMFFIGKFCSGVLTSFDPVKQYISARLIAGGTESRQLQSDHAVPVSLVAPFNSLVRRPCNKNRFKNTIIKRGYYNETCDINISKFGAPILNSDTNNCEWFDFGHGFTDIGAAMKRDCWSIGKINFDRTLWTAVFYTCNKSERVVDPLDIYDVKKYNQMRPRLEKSFNLFQIFIDVDITQYYDKYNAAERTAIHEMAEQCLSTRNGRTILTVAVHGDDRSMLSYLGDKSSIEDRTQITTSGFCDTRVDKAKQIFLDLIGYPNYCVITPSGCICRLDDENAFDVWCRRWKQYNILPALFNAGIRQRGIDQNILDRIYYNEDKDELHVKMVYTDAVTLVTDSDAPASLNNAYRLTIGSEQRPRLIDAIITEPGLIDINYNVGGEFEENSTDTQDKRTIYFERLRQWEGHFRCTFDITDLFDEFQERLKNEWDAYENKRNDTKKNKNMDITVDHDDFQEWPGNRKYFTNSNVNDMSLNAIRLDRRRNRILYNDYICPVPDEINFIVDHDYSLSISNRLGKNKSVLLLNILHYSGISEFTCRLVCKEWNNEYESMWFGD